MNEVMGYNNVINNSVFYIPSEVATEVVSAVNQHSALNNAVSITNSSNEPTSSMGSTTGKPHRSSPSFLNKLLNISALSKRSGVRVPMMTATTVTPEGKKLRDLANTLTLCAVTKELFLLDPETGIRNSACAGLFRQDGNKTEITEFSQRLAQGEVALEDYEKLDTHVLGSLVKQQLRNLPVPVIDQNTFTAMKNDPDHALSILNARIENLPELPEYDEYNAKRAGTLISLIIDAYRAADDGRQSEFNKNGIVSALGPALFPPPANQPELEKFQSMQEYADAMKQVASEHLESCQEIARNIFANKSAPDQENAPTEQRPLSPVLQSRSPSPVAGNLQTSFAHADDIKATFGETVTFFGSRPTVSVDRPSIWESKSRPGYFGIKFPGNGNPQLAEWLDDAKQKLKNYIKLTSSPSEVAAKCAPAIDQEQLGLLEVRMKQVSIDLKAFQRENPTLLLDASLARFRDITAIKQTAVGKDLSANQITIAGKKIAIATQYPKDDQIARQLDMYMTQGVNTVVVLSSDNDFNDPRPERKITDYFSKSASFSDAGKGSKITVETAVKQRESEKLPDGSELRTYQMTLTNAKGQQKQMQVLHLANWPDHGVISAQDTLTLAKRLEGKNVAVHCTAGVGRTGVLVGTRAMNELQQQPDKPSLEAINTEMRQQRSPHMVQTEGQRKLMAEIATRLGFPVVN